MDLSNLSETEQVTLLLGAFRYYMGRRSYAVSDCADLLQKLWPEMGDRAKRLITAELQEAKINDDHSREQGGRYHPMGDDCDRQTWLNLLTFIEHYQKEKH